MNGDTTPLAGLQSELHALRPRPGELEPRFESHAMELLRCVLANAPDFIAMLAPDGTILFVNRVRGGATLDAVLGKTVYDYTAPGQVAAYRACVEAVLRTGTAGWIEHEAQLSDGTTAWYETRLGPIRDGESVIAVILIATDVSPRKRAARALRESEVKLRMAADASGIGLWSWDMRSDVVAWEPVICGIFGLAPGTAPAGREGFVALVHPEDRSRVAEDIQRGVGVGTWEDEYRIVRADGAVRWVMAKGSVLRDAESDIVLGAVIDVTDRKLRDEQLRQAQKLEAVGQLTAGIAHNFNNMLMGVLPNLELALQQAPPALAPLLHGAQHAAQRAADLVRQLMTYAGRNRPAARRAEAIGPLVERTVTMCRTTFDRRIAFESRYDGYARALVDPTQLEQALLNLLINARDALREGVEAPRLRVEVSLVRAGSPEVTRAEVPRGDYVRVRIVDNGKGMDAATLARIYEPFFTTKDTGEGTGLGLATAHAIVREHGGWITCTSTPSFGATFSMYLPSDVSATADEHVPAKALSARGHETVLVVDDEPRIRQVVALMLEGAGYTARLAASGDQALDMLGNADAAAAVAVILLDVSMPGVPRVDLRERLRVLAPHARVVYFTGYAFEASDAEDAVLEKPVTQAQLLSTIRHVLERKSAPDAQLA